MRKIKHFLIKHPIRVLAGILIVGAAMAIYYFYSLQILNQDILSFTKEADSAKSELKKLKMEDQYVINKNLTEEVSNINKSYKKAVSLYEEMLDIKLTNEKKADFEELFASILDSLAERKYASAEANIATLGKQLETEKTKIVKTTVTSPSFTNVGSSNTPPSSGYSRQRVKTEIGEYVADIVSADLGSTKVIVDTASDGDCSDNCPVLSLAGYVARSGAFAGINGSYFCPASYPSCAGKTNSFDTLLMNKNKTYLNSDNNVYSTVPVAVFGNGWARFMGRSLDWGRVTDVDGVIANQPLLLSGGNIAFGGDGDPKKGGKGSRSFIGNKGSTVYIGVVHNATVAEVAYALKALDLENALNLDSGGSTALWSGGYKAGPGRDIPNAILFVRR